MNLALGTTQLAHVLAIEFVGRAKESDDDLSRSLAILSEIVVSSEVYRAAKATGQVVTFPTASGLAILFTSDSAEPVRCALELWEMFRELPSMTVVMGVHSGQVGVAERETSRPRAIGDGIEVVQELVAGGAAGQILLSEAYAKSLSENAVWSAHIQAAPEGFRIEPQKLFILGQGSQAGGEEQPRLGSVLSDALSRDGHETYGDQQTKVDIAWAKSLEARIRSADTVVALVSDSAEDSEIVGYELEIAMDERRKRGKPQILPVWLKEGPMPEGPLAALNQNLHHAVWQGADDDARIVSEVRTALAAGQVETNPHRLDSAGGAVASTSRFYVERAADKDFENALLAHESIILVKGPRQIGKTSLIGRGVRFADELGWRTVTTDFQKLSSRQLESEDHFYLVLATSLALELEHPLDPETDWLDALGPNLNMGRFLRDLVASSDRPIVWFIDEADRLFTAPFASEFFGLVRSWHNARATDPRGPWARLTIVIGYATEAHLFIEDLNQSPFNVGCSVPLPMFSLENTADLNERYGRPLASADVPKLYSLICGQPFLTRRAFDVLARKKMDFETLLKTADQEDGPFGDHLKRILVSVTQLPFVWEALWQSVATPNLQDSRGLVRLIAAGILVHKPPHGFTLACDLYRRFLSRFVEAI